jgi:hypothetical protein
MPHNLLIVQKRFKCVLCRDQSLSHAMCSTICSLKSTCICGNRSFIFDLHRKLLFFWILLPGRKIYFLDLLSCTQFLNYTLCSLLHPQLKLYWLVKYLSCTILYYKVCLKSWQTIVVFPYLLPFTLTQSSILVFQETKKLLAFLYIYDIRRIVSI